VRVVKHWPRLPREAVAAPSLAVLKASLDGALSNLVWWKMSLLMAGGLEPDDLSSPFQPKPFHDSMILCVPSPQHYAACSSVECPQYLVGARKILDSFFLKGSFP